MQNLKQQILIIEDSKDLGSALLRLLASKGYQASLVERAEDVVNTKDYALILSDLKLPGISGIDFLKKLHTERVTVPVIIMTAFGTIDLAVEAVKLGAAEFITKPFDSNRLLSLIEHVLSLKVNNPQNSYVKRSEIITENPEMLSLLEQATKVAPLDCPVLILGESGTGKELVARHIHQHSSRKQNPYVAVNCASMPHDLLESEFFGHEAGAFTGATRARPGLFEEANHGTLFLDEIGTMPHALQGKLLRALQESEIRRIGSNAYRKVNVRIISATNSDLTQGLADHSFRDDLYYRLGVVILEVPPLRRRKEDIPILIKHFAEQFAKKFGLATPEINTTLIKSLTRYPWPGNIRELENAVERALILADGKLTQNSFELSKIPEQLLTEENGTNLHQAVSEVVRRTEISMITQALLRSGGNKVKASKALGVSYKTLINKTKEYNLGSGKGEDVKEQFH